jgi:alpha-beta hydrolase superfamily lysophospholipase
MPRRSRDDEESIETLSLEILDVETGPVRDGVEELRLVTGDGTIQTRFHDAEPGDAAALWVGGAGGGLDGPAGGLYPRLASQLTGDGIASLRLHYRQPNHFTACVLDTLAGVELLASRGRTSIALVGHSFGGAVVITAGAVNKQVAAVAALSSQTFGTDLVGEISPRPLLLIHGTDDEILSDACSRDIHRRAAEPKEILLYPGCRHGLDECREAVDRTLLTWLRRVLA